MQSNSGIKLIFDPLPFEEYLSLLLGSDIVLLLYDEEKYYARSSGILVECLAAGIPVIVPSGTWLSRQFVREMYKHYDSLRAGMSIEKEYDMEGTVWRRHNSSANPYQRGELICGGENAKAYCWIERPMRSEFLYLNMKLNGPYLTAVKVDIAQLRDDATLAKFNSYVVEKVDDSPKSLLLHIEDDCERMWVGFKNAFGNSVTSLSNVQIDLLRARGGKDSKLFPLGAVGLAYDRPEEISQLLREIITYYPHYRGTAIEFSKHYGNLHNANSLISRIVQLSGKEEAANTKLVDREASAQDRM